MKTPQGRAMHNHTRNVFLQIAKFCIPLLALLMFAKLSPAVMAMLADQSVQRGMIAQAQSKAAEHYLSILLN
ncbi:hypothetical protein EN858_19805 [Mesorhizobium sp. M4B.F.Ca.ET.215.01.1.1]|uniref:hypothetical protein n=1 Tax=unclassified Mesorhizobium TaxID=325217 RepID=UPI000FCBA0E7|nr:MULTISPECIES: hypothetical protein [unclassified Mesorhizobium]RUW22588.1 hypothetical protein EOA34_20975 [Mesorhizobium sp. M4B.F.Ca.ET.013.02.1.1]RUW78844.1 hypothetical protein EOA31_00015 [Mesorhizobium sp. M4B.F.Ca.ET.049.02.1.2]RWF67119.1 MAG: hypothetical protein EOS47_03170 [Mesorhizobium sp.]TGQ09526.1 hypothetical protein EN858_19805 [Mesorhizobium sp. M4B.F.Ca.ET.215.01.1.1]TGQ36960.1 hypothetical protein EN857_15270 [Mesorhizobium sp. M4B.F.Ca.ET.214.01.1.1]